MAKKHEPTGRPVGRPKDKRDLQKAFLVRFGRTEDDYIRAVAKDREISLNEVVRELVEFALEAKK